MVQVHSLSPNGVVFQSALDLVLKTSGAVKGLEVGTSPHRQNVKIAQLVEHQVEALSVIGSKPILHTNMVNVV